MSKIKNLDNYAIYEQLGFATAAEFVDVASKYPEQTRDAISSIQNSCGDTVKVQAFLSYVIILVKYKIKNDLDLNC
jgi:hypothetical protein